MKLPSKVRIGYRDWRVRIVHSLGDDHGRCEVDAGEILLADTDDSGELYNTFLHEMLHAILHTYGASQALSEKKEEYLVTVLANGLHQALADPALRKYLSKKPGAAAC